LAAKPHERRPCGKEQILRNDGSAVVTVDTVDRDVQPLPRFCVAPAAPLELEERISEQTKIVQLAPVAVLEDAARARVDSVLEPPAPRGNDAVELERVRIDDGIAEPASNLFPRLQIARADAGRAGEREHEGVREVAPRLHRGRAETIRRLQSAHRGQDDAGGLTARE